MLSKTRIKWIDIAKTYGIFLVFYSHLIQRYHEAWRLPLDESVLFPQYKLIYSFHMVLFFILSGFFARERLPDFFTFFKEKIVSRLIPVVFFEMIVFPYLYFTRWHGISEFLSNKWTSLI